MPTYGWSLGSNSMSLAVLVGALGVSGKAEVFRSQVLEGQSTEKRQCLAVEAILLRRQKNIIGREDWETLNTSARNPLGDAGMDL